MDKVHNKLLEKNERKQLIKNKQTNINKKSK